ncbi:hypothetical protein J2Y74_004277 [Pseudomonas migulae]|nr:hypothetical protein [Pseudomonas migulae]
MRAKYLKALLKNGIILIYCNASATPLSDPDAPVVGTGKSYDQHSQSLSETQ